MKVRIFGSSGFVGTELNKILSKRQEIRIINCKVDDFLEENVEVAFLALPSKQSLELVPRLLGRGIKVIDLSNAYRLRKEAVYGLPEKNREAIKNAKIIASPGCYPTAIILGLWPLVKSNFISPITKIVVKAVSGYTGAGKGVKIPKTITPYKYKDGREHQHISEIERELNLKNQLFFYPQIAPWPRGILTAIRVRLLSKISKIDVFNLYKEFYQKEFFVRVKSDVSIDEVIGTNFCDIDLKIEQEDWLRINVVIDNLGKGAAGQAVQNFNILCGFSEKYIY